MKSAGLSLIIFGICLLLYGLLMDTTVDSYYNVGLMNERLSILLIGGFTFLAGIILFAVFKIRQTPEDEAKQEAEFEAAQMKMRSARGRALDSVASGISGLLKHLTWGHCKEHFSRPRDSRTGRTLTGLIVGVCLALPAALVFSFWSPLIVLVALWLAFRPIPASKAMRNLLAANAILYILIEAIAVIALSRIARGLVETLATIIVLGFPVLVSLLSAVCYWYVGDRKARSK